MFTRRRYAIRAIVALLVVTLVELLLDDLERKVLVALGGQDEPETLEVLGTELPVPGLAARG